MTGPDQVIRLRSGVDKRAHSQRTIVGGDPRSGTVTRIHAHGKRGIELVCLLGDHHSQSQLVKSLTCKRNADEATTVSGHEVDGLGRTLVRSHDQISLVLALLIVNEDDHLALPYVFQYVGYAV